MTVTVKPIDLTMRGARDVVTRSLLIAKLRLCYGISVTVVQVTGNYLYIRFVTGDSMKIR